MSKERKTKSPDSYEVGYRKPPSQTRFRPGVSGNPKGRPRPDRQTVIELLLQESSRLVEVTEAGKPVRMSMQHLVIRSVFANAAKGNGPAQRIVFPLLLNMEAQQSADPLQDALKQITDEEFLERMIAQLRHLVQNN